MRTFWAGILFFVLTLCGPASWAESWHLSKAELLSHGINPPMFQVVEFSPDGRMLLGYQVNLRDEVAKGITNRLFELNLRSDGKVTGVRSHDLSVPAIEQIALSPDGREVVVITASGAAFVALDRDTGEVRTLMAHEPRQPGFRSHPPILLRAGGNLLATGFFYDEEDYGGSDSIARIDLTRSGLEAFELVAEIEKLERSLKRLVINAYTDHETGYFCIQREGSQVYTLYRWKAGQEPEAFDEALSVPGFMPKGDKLAYVAQRSGGVYELVIYDGPSATRQVVTTSPVELGYLTFSEDGSTVQVNEINEERMKLFTASSRTGWKYQPVPDLPRSSMADIRLSPDGRWMSLYNQDGLRIISLP
ncbi:MAG: hypothetical protein ACOX9B_06255 [Candidatus Xenobium sp.]|jgi:hypothetical protein